MEELVKLQHDDGYPQGFTLIDNRDVWDRCDRNRKFLLRPATAGVYLGMRSLPQGWEFRESWLIAHVGLGRDALRRCIRELETKGRLSRKVIRDELGRYVRTVWTLHRAGTGAPLTDFPATDQPSPVKSVTGRTRCREIPTQINREEESNTETTTTSGPMGDLAWPTGFSDEDRVVVERLTQSLDVQDRQDVLDEFAGMLDSGLVKSTGGLLTTLVEAREAGTFTLNYGRKVRTDRERRMAISAAEAAAAAETRIKEDKKAAAQARLHQMNDRQVHELATDVSGLDAQKVDDWLTVGRPSSHHVAALLRGAISCSQLNARAADSGAYAIKTNREEGNDY